MNLANDLKYSILTETSLAKLWGKLEKLYMSKSLKNRLYLKRQLYELKMEEGSDVRSHINKFNKCINQLLSVEVKIDEEDEAVILLSSLPKSYESLRSTLLIRKSTLIVDEMSF